MGSPKRALEAGLRIGLGGRAHQVTIGRDVGPAAVLPIVNSLAIAA